MDRTAFLVIVSACLMTACGNGGSADGGGPARVGASAPAWSEPSIPGPKLSLASLRGKAVYLNFFASWCPPCNEEAPQVDALAKNYAGRGLQVVGVDVLENANKAKSFRDAHRLSYPIVIDSGTLRNQYAINGLPVHVFIDRAGIVRKIVVGELSPADMRMNVERVLQ